MELKLLGKRSTVVADRTFVEGGNGNVKLGGLGRFFRAMKEAGFGKVEFPEPITSVNAITEFTRELGSVRDYVNKVVARNPGHIRQVRNGFETIGATRFAAVLVSLERLSAKLGGSAALVQAAREGHPAFRRMNAALKKLDWEEMNQLRAQWLQSQPDVLIVDGQYYRDAMITHANALRAANQN